MQRLLLIAGSALALTACSTMHGTGGHHAPYAKLGKIAQEHDAQQALLQTREGKIVVVNVATGEIVKPTEKPKTSAAEENGQDQNGMGAKKISDEEFAEIKRRFERTITISVTKGSVCLKDTTDGRLYEICSPPAPQWW